VYIPEVNFLMGLASIIVTIAFRTTTSIGNAYGKLKDILHASSCWLFFFL
jgi:K+ transporter